MYLYEKSLKIIFLFTGRSSSYRFSYLRRMKYLVLMKVFLETFLISYVRNHTSVRTHLNMSICNAKCTVSKDPQSRAKSFFKTVAVTSSNLDRRPPARLSGKILAFISTFSFVAYTYRSLHFFSFGTNRPCFPSFFNYLPAVLITPSAKNLFIVGIKPFSGIKLSYQYFRLRFYELY